MQDRRSPRRQARHPPRLTGQKVLRDPVGLTHRPHPTPPTGPPSPDGGQGPETTGGGKRRSQLLRPRPSTPSCVEETSFGVRGRLRPPVPIHVCLQPSSRGLEGPGPLRGCDPLLGSWWGQNGGRKRTDLCVRSDLTRNTTNSYVYPITRSRWDRPSGRDPEAKEGPTSDFRLQDCNTKTPGGNKKRCHFSLYLRNGVYSGCGERRDGGSNRWGPRIH